LPILACALQLAWIKTLAFLHIPIRHDNFAPGLEEEENTGDIC